MYNPAFDPSAGLRLWTEMVRISLESQYVIGMRFAGMMGIMPHAGTENTRMLSEKSDAARESISAALQQVTIGARPDQVMAAALRPYGKRTHANARRLSRAR